MSENTQENPKNIEIFALATDPIYIGTGGYTIGRVDNTIVRDPITNIPKIPGSSLAGTWRYYTVLEALKDIKNKQPKWEDIKNSEGNTIEEKLETIKWENTQLEGWKGFLGNQVMRITCAGQDDAPNEEIDSEKNTGHCGHCIVCKGFGFSKKYISWQGQIFFSDLNILFFPVFTIKGTKWITTDSKLKEIGITDVNEPLENKILTEKGDEGHLNLGWLYLEVEGEHSIRDENLNKLAYENFKLKPKDVIIVPEELFSHIVNSNLEVRTSVSIDPITGAAKEKALFTSEAIPRGTIFYGNVRIFDKSVFEGIEPKLKPLPDKNKLSNALKDSKHYYESLGIGGMTTRGFGRLKINLKEKNSNGGNQNESTTNG